MPCATTCSPVLQTPGGATHSSAICARGSISMGTNVVVFATLLVILARMPGEASQSGVRTFLMKMQHIQTATDLMSVII